MTIHARPNLNGDIPATFAMENFGLELQEAAQ